MALTDKLVAIADAIRDKTGSSEKITLDDMPSKIASITGGGIEKFINFYNHDGALVHQYPLGVFASMATLPIPPNNKTGCSCVGWNYDIETIKNMNSHVNVAAIYNNDTAFPQEIEEYTTHYVDGTKLYYHIDHNVTVYVYYRQSKANGVTIDWGDGTSSTSTSSSGSNNLSFSHAYTPGDYVATFSVIDGCTLSLGNASSSYSVAGNCNFNATWIPRLQTLVKAEIDLRNTKLLSYAFKYCLGLTDIVFGDGTEISIPTNCFECCYALENVTLPNSVTSIGNYAFSACYRLNHLNLPSTLKSIGDYAFLNCRRLQALEIPALVTSIGGYCFQSCYSLKRIQLYDGTTKIGQSCFVDCYSLEEINFPNTITSIGSNAFQNCRKLQTAVLPTGITSISSSCFSGCLSLSSVFIPEGVKTIQASAFYQCSLLKFIAFPRSVTSIGSSAFYGCYSLHNAVLGQNLTTIETTAFYQCTALEYLIIPTSVTSVGVKAFYDCRGIKNFSIPTTLSHLPSILSGCELQSDLVEQAVKTSVLNCKSVPESAFEGSPYLTNVQLPSEITSVGKNAFKNNRRLQRLTLPSRITSIPEAMMQGDKQLQSITVPSTVTTIGNSAFDECSSMKKVVFPASVKTLNSSAFQRCYNLEEVEIKGINTQINASAFNACYRLKKIKFPNDSTGVTVAGSAFAVTGLENLDTIPMNTTFTDTNAFASCYSLTDADASKLKSTNTNGLSSMFASCYSLESVKLPSKVTHVGTSMLSGCTALKDIIDIPQNIMTLYASAFSECRNLKGVRFLGNSVTTIQSNAFNYCYAMKEIHLPYSLTSMASAFPYCYGLHDIYCYSLKPPTGTSSLGNLAEGYVIHVPRGSLSLYQTQWSSHKNNMAEFDFLKCNKSTLFKTISRVESSITLKNSFIHTAFAENQTYTVTPVYNGSNLTAVNNLVVDIENGLITFDIERSETINFDALETLGITINIDGTDISCNFTIELRYVDGDIISEYNIVQLGGYPFIEEADNYYISTNKGVQNSYSLCAIEFTTSTGKLYLDCIGAGESNYDYGIISELDEMLTASNAADSGSVVKKSFYGLGSYTQTVEFDVLDTAQHFVCVKFRKDGSVDSGMDAIKFAVRFE